MTPRRSRWWWHPRSAVAAWAPRRSPRSGLARTRGVDALVGGVEQHNEASHRCVKAAGFVAVADDPDDEGFINYVLRLDALALRAAP
jgi:hypothetical protein